MHNIDNIDRRLLRLMQHDPTASAADLASLAGVTKASCWRRIERLEANAIVTGRSIQIDPKALGYEVEVSLRITLDKTFSNAFDDFIVEARKILEVN